MGGFRLPSGFMRDGRIARLRRPGQVLLWIRLLDVAGECFPDGVFVDEAGRCGSERLASLLGGCDAAGLAREIEILRNAGLVEVREGVLSIPDWERYKIDTEAEERRRAASRRSSQRYRDRQKALKHEGTKPQGPKPAEAKPAAVADGYTGATREIVAYMNQVMGTHYRPGSSVTREHIHARLAEGFTVDDFKKVVDGRYAAWHGDARMEPYLRPQTLFGRKFEGYLMQAERNAGENDGGREAEECFRFAE